MAQKKTVEVKLLIDELKYDILNETFLRGRTIQNNTNYKEVASMFASVDEENLDKILRSIKRALAEVKTELGEYLSESGLSTDNTLIDEDTDLTIALTMPTNFNEAATAGIGEAIHNYIVNSAVADWYLVTNKSDAQDYVALASKALESIRESVSKRSRPMRRSTATKP